MPQEASRTTARKRITIGSSFVDVPVITQISFIDPTDRYREIQFSIDNSSNASRQVHIDTIGTSPQLEVERIDQWAVLDPADRYQETQITMDNVTGADATPPHFSTHLQTHVVRYKNPGDSSVWIDSELIDSFSVLDPNDRGQETVFTLNNPATDDEAQADPSDPDITDKTGNIDPGWRTDPFQNLIDVHGASGLVSQYFVFRRWGSSCGTANLAVGQSTNSFTEGGDWYPVEPDWVAAKQAAGETWPTYQHTIAYRTLLSDLISACLSLSHQYGQVPDVNMDGQFGSNPWIEWLNFSSLAYQNCYLAESPPYIGPPVAEPSTDNFFNHIYTIVLGYAAVDDVGTAGPTIPPGTPTWVPPT